MHPRNGNPFSQRQEEQNEDRWRRRETIGERVRRRAEEKAQREEEDERLRLEEEERLRLEEEERIRELRRVRNEQYRRNHPNLDEELGLELQRRREAGEVQKMDRETRHQMMIERRRRQNEQDRQQRRVVTNPPNEETEETEEVQPAPTVENQPLPEVENQTLPEVELNQESSESLVAPGRIESFEDANAWFRINCPELILERVNYNRDAGFLLRGFRTAARNYTTTQMLRTLRAFGENMDDGRMEIIITMYNDDRDGEPDYGRDTRTLTYTLRGLMADDVMDDLDEDMVRLDAFWSLYQDNVYNNGGRFTLPPLAKIQSIVIVAGQIAHERNTTDAGLFLFYLKPEFSIFKEVVKRYQLYTQEEFTINENCFIHACRLSGLFTNEEVEGMKIKIMNQFVSKKTLNLLSSLYGFKIIITKNKSSNKKCHEEIGRGERVLNLFLWKSSDSNHYFLNEDTKITSFCVRNYNEIKNSIQIDDLNSVRYLVRKTSQGFQRNNNSATMSSFKLLEELLKIDALIPVKGYHLISKFLSLGINKEITVPNLTEFESREIKPKEKKPKVYTLFFADFECFTKGIHTPFCCCCVGNEKTSPIKTFYGLDCVNQLLNYLKNFKNPCCYFHNLGYDGRMLAKHGAIKIIKKGNKIYSLTLIYGEKKILFKDSLALIPTSISKFNEFFSLNKNFEKEIFPYNYYNEDTYLIGDVENCWQNEAPEWENEKIIKFKENIEKLGLTLNGGKFKTKEYCIYYCKRDVEILKEGFNVFRTMTKTNLNIDIIDYLSLSSLAYGYFSQEAFSDRNIYEYTGMTREYIRSSVMGGRNMTGENLKWKVEEDIVDFDACSLYPSAMARLYLPEGKPIKMTVDVHELLPHLMEEQQIFPTAEKYISAFVVRIEILKINKPRKMPIVMVKTKQINSYKNLPCCMTVDNIYLEDLIKYQEIEFRFIDGIYWEGNKNIDLSETIKKVYNIRKEMKARKDVNEIIYKLIMNSAYGKTIQKCPTEEVKFVRKLDRFKPYWSRNYYKIKKCELIGEEFWMVEEDIGLDNYYAPVMVGCLILSMSKRIMNELIYLCEDNEISVFYQDTDSIHILKKDLPDLEELYNSFYNRELIGGNVGQFHSDFPTVNGKESWARRSIFLGKKAYLDILTNEDKEEQCHIRLKGIPEAVIRGKAEESYGGDIEALYEDLFDGKTVEFDLNRYGPHFKINPNMTIESFKEFKRNIKF